MLRHWTFYFMTRRIQDKLGKYIGTMKCRVHGRLQGEKREKTLRCLLPILPLLPVHSIYPQPGKLGRRGCSTSSFEPPFHQPWVAISSGFPFPGWHPSPILWSAFLRKVLANFLSCHSKANQQGSLVGSNPVGGAGNPNESPSREALYLPCQRSALLNFKELCPCVIVPGTVVKGFLAWFGRLCCYLGCHPRP